MSQAAHLPTGGLDEVCLRRDNAVCEQDSKNFAAEDGNGYRPKLHRFMTAWVVVTFGLVILGGTVTSKGVGLAVPDWPTTFDYNMFLFPPSMWKGGIFWEHTHRLLGSVVGLMGIIAAGWLWWTQRGRSWLRWLGVAALILVIVQGVMGGLRVTELDYRWGIAHGVIGQVFLCMTVLLTAATSRYWIEAVGGRTKGVTAKLPTVRPWSDPTDIRRLIKNKSILASRRWSWMLLGVMLIQLILGAAMRHSGSGLAIPDFPSSYGQLVPPLNQEAVTMAINAMPYDQMQQYYTVSQVGLNFAHRVWAVVVTVVVIGFVARMSHEATSQPLLKTPLLALVGLMLCQLALGASVVWSGRHPELATGHQATGAALLATVTLLAIRIQLSARYPSSRSIRPGDAHVAKPQLVGKQAGAI